MKQKSQMASFALVTKPVMVASPAAADIFSESPKPQSGLVTWDVQKQQRLNAVITKPVDDWNKKDCLHYVNWHYREVTGKSIQYAWGIDYGIMDDVRVLLNRHFCLTVCPNSLLRDYIDFAFEKYVIPHIGRGKKFVLSLLKTPAWVMDFAQKQRRADGVIGVSTGTLAQAEVVQTQDAFNLAALDSAVKINAKHFITTYGAVLFVNYQILVKGKVLADAIKLTQAAIDKAKADVEVLSATNRYAPYPSWLPFTAVESLDRPWLTGIQFSADNGVLGFLKEFVK